MGSAGGHAVQHVPAFVPRLAETARSQPFEVPNSLLSQESRTCGCWAGMAMVLGAAEYGVRDVHTWQSAEGTYWSTYGVPAAAHCLTWLAEHPDYGLSDIEAEVAAHATACTGEPTEETEPARMSRMTATARATRSIRIDSAAPSRLFGTSDASPLRAATASAASDLPRWRRACRSGRITSTTGTPAAARWRASPQP
jgi:hypothetical protein